MALRRTDCRYRSRYSGRTATFLSGWPPATTWRSISLARRVRLSVGSPMTDGRLTNPSRQSTLMKKTASWLLIIPSILIGIFLFELLSQLFLPWVSNADPSMQRLIYFFDGPDTIFRD